jgi:signal transduction histidine kinase
MHGFTSSDFSTLRAIPELRKVPDGQLKWLLDKSTCTSLSKGEYLFVPDAPLEHLYVILEGTLDMLSSNEGNRKVLFQFQRGEILGYLPYSNLHKSPFFVQCLTDVRLCGYPKSAIQEMICDTHELTNAFVQVLLFKARNLSTLTLQNEKLLALGKLTAGLSHELNNPISSIQRDAADLDRLFNSGPLLELIVRCESLEATERSNLRQSLLSWKDSRRANEMKPAEIRKMEIDWLERLSQWGMLDPEEAAEVFTDSGIAFEEVSYWVEKINPSIVNEWLHGVQFFLQSQAVVNTIQKATERVKSLTRAVKTFTHMGRESIRADLNLAQGIEDTLIILSHKIKVAKIEVSFRKPQAPCTVVGFAGELNQIWTNLIDNAIDALQGTEFPKLEIVITPENEFVRVSITDNGPGIPEEIQSRIFDPFFTTKGMGKGSGLGLDLVTQLVSKHRGKIRLDSISGRTAFHLEFPRG